MTDETPFRTDHAPPIGKTEWLAPDLRVVTAPNGGPMTFTGTRSYIVGTGEVALIDPGPDDEAHFAALGSALGRGERVSHVLVTHSHIDHSGLAPRVAQHFGALLLAFGDSRAGQSELMERLAASGGLGGGEGVDPDFSPDRALTDGAIVSGETWSLEAVYTPGHMANHLCFASAAHAALFSGDHVMGWATTLVSPPDGDLTRFRASLEKLLGRNESIYYPGHGAPVPEPAKMIGYQIHHRNEREAQILEILSRRRDSATGIAEEIYRDLAQPLRLAARRNVLAHLIDLSERGLICPMGELRADAVFELL
jgi:glyoxylase-like metal-dependent hydrolase (beta-lactamase superfamily II)